MKALLIIFMLVSPFTNHTESPQNFAAISKAISDGDAVALSNFFDQSVEVAIMDQEDIYDKAQATQVVKTFFSKNKPKAYTQVHQGASKGKDSQYSIGNLQTSSGNYRVYLYLKVSGSNYIIQELRFDKE